MFEDTAEEEPNAAWVYFTRATRLNLKPGTYLSTLSAYAVTLNYVLGLGCLGIPYAFFKAGLGFSIVVTCVAAFVSMLSTMWIVEVHMRAMILKTGRRQDRSWSDHSQQHHQTQTQTTTSSSTYATYSTTTVNTPPSSSFPRNAFKSPGTASQLTELLSSPHFFASTKSPVIEVASLVKGVLGKKVEILYMICLSGLAITGLWAYSNVAANSLVQQVRWKPCASPNFLGECGNAMTVVATVATVATTCLTLTLIVFVSLCHCVLRRPCRMGIHDQLCGVWYNSCPSLVAGHDRTSNDSNHLYSVEVCHIGRNGYFLPAGNIFISGLGWFSTSTRSIPSTFQCDQHVQRHWSTLLRQRRNLDVANWGHGFAHFIHVFFNVISTLGAWVDGSGGPQPTQKCQTCVWCGVDLFRTLVHCSWSDHGAVFWSLHITLVQS